MIHSIIQTIKEQFPFHYIDPVLHLQLWQYLVLGMLIVGAVVMAWLVVTLSTRAISFSGDELAMFLSLRRRIYYFAMAGVIIYAKSALGLPCTVVWQNVMIVLNVVFVVLSLLLVSRFIDLSFSLLNRKMREEHWDEIGILQIFRALARVGAVMLTLLLVSRLFFDYGLGTWVKSVSIGAGTLTAILALASKDLIGNFFGALVVTVGKPFKVGDWILVNKLEGRVDSIDMRATKITTGTGGTIYVPNSVFVSSNVSNYGKGVYVPVSLSLLLKTADEGGVEGFLETLHRLLKGYPVLQGGKYRVEVGKVALSKVSLTLHLYFELMTATEKFRHLHALMRDVRAIAKKHEIALED